MNIQDLLAFVAQLTEPEVSEQVLDICHKAADTYVEPFCEIIAKSCETMYRSLLAQGFTSEQAMQLTVAMAGKKSGGK